MTGIGPHRQGLLAAALPADAASRREHQTAELTKRLQRIDAAENAHAREIEHLATLPPDAPAVAALRTRILARFTELENERTAINTNSASSPPLRPLPSTLLCPARPAYSGTLPPSE